MREKLIQDLVKPLIQSIDEDIVNDGSVYQLFEKPFPVMDKPKGAYSVTYTKYPMNLIYQYSE